jgi:endonuclease III
MKRPQYAVVIRALKPLYPGPAASAKPDPWQTVLFTALTARSRDDQVEPLFQALMRKYPTPARLAAAKQKDVERIIRSIGFYRNKSKNAIALAKAVVARHAGKVPRTMEELVALPGVGRKTASCTLVYAFRIPAIAVDTHVHRIVNRLGWTRTSAPEKTERALLATLPKGLWLDINHVMVPFGRDVCKPIIPQCWRCPVARQCAYPTKTAAPRSARV